MNPYRVSTLHNNTHPHLAISEKTDMCLQDFKTKEEISLFLWLLRKLRFEAEGMMLRMVEAGSSQHVLPLLPGKRLSLPGCLWSPAW